MGAADHHGWRRTLRDQLAVAGEAGELMGCREPRQNTHPCCVQDAGAAHVHVDAGVGRGRLDVERLVLGFKRLRDRPGCWNGAIERRRQHRAAVDADDVVSAERRKADFEDVARAEPGMERGAAAAIAVGVDQRVHRRIEAGLRKCFDHQGALPFLIIRRRPMLDRAAAANAEMRTERLDALRACGFDPQQMAAIRMAGDALDLDGLARQRVGHEHGPSRRIRHAVAAMGDAVDGEPLGQWQRRQASRPASTLAASRPSASNTFLTMPLASSPALAYIAVGES